MDDMTEEQIEEFTRQISATIIQRLWKSYIYKKAIHQTVPSKREALTVFFSSMPQTQKIKSDTDKLFVMLNGNRFKYFKFDLIDNKMAQGWVKDQLNHFPLPFVKFNEIFIGSYEEFEKLFVLDLVRPILKKEYLNKCLICEKPRENQKPDAICEKCEKPYLFFKKQNQQEQLQQLQQQQKEAQEEQQEMEQQ